MVADALADPAQSASIASTTSLPAGSKAPEVITLGEGALCPLFRKIGNNQDLTPLTLVLRPDENGQGFVAGEVKVTEKELQQRAE